MANMINWFEENHLPFTMINHHEASVIIMNIHEPLYSLLLVIIPSIIISKSPHDDHEDTFRPLFIGRVASSGSPGMGLASGREHPAKSQLLHCLGGWTIITKDKRVIYTNYHTSFGSGYWQDIGHSTSIRGLIVIPVWFINGNGSD